MSQAGRKLCTADKSWKSLDAGSLNETYVKNLSAQGLASADFESYPSSETQKLPPPAKFFNSRQKLLDMETGRTDSTSPLVSPASSSTDTMVSFPFSDGPESPASREDCFCSLYQPVSPKKAALRNLQRKSNFVVGLQNEAERRRQGCYR